MPDQPPKLVIRPKIQGYLRRGTEAELTALHASLDRDGCLDSVKVWHDKEKDQLVVLDGRRRLAHCNARGIPYAVEVIESVTTETEAIAWCREFQESRRNQTQQLLGDLSRARNRAEQMIAEQLKKTEGRLPEAVARRIADEVCLARRTVYRMAEKIRIDEGYPQPQARKCGTPRYDHDFNRAFDDMVRSVEKRSSCVGEGPYYIRIQGILQDLTKQMRLWREKTDRQGK